MKISFVDRFNWAFSTKLVPITAMCVPIFIKICLLISELEGQTTGTFKLGHPVYIVYCTLGSFQQNWDDGSSCGLMFQIDFFNTKQKFAFIISRATSLKQKFESLSDLKFALKSCCSVLASQRAKHKPGMTTFKIGPRSGAYGGTLPKSNCVWSSVV